MIREWLRQDLVEVVRSNNDNVKQEFLTEEALQIEGIDVLEGIKNAGNTFSSGAL